MKLIAVLLIAALCLPGCATYQASQNPNVTPEQLVAAECKDAQDTVLAADLALIMIDMSDPARIRWEKKRAAAQKVVDRYCGGPK